VLKRGWAGEVCNVSLLVAIGASLSSVKLNNRRNPANVNYIAVRKPFRGQTCSLTKPSMLVA
jgi:hypothetical protein